MAIHIEEVTEADFPHFVEAEQHAYGATKSAASHVLFPGPFTFTGVEARVQQLLDMRRNDETNTFLKAVDTETGDLMAFAKWNIYLTGEIAKNAPGRPIPSGPGCNLEACQAFFGGLVQKKAQLIGNKPHVCQYCPFYIRSVAKESYRSSYVTYGPEVSEAWCCKCTDQMGLSKSGRAGTSNLS